MAIASGCKNQVRLPCTFPVCCLQGNYGCLCYCLERRERGLELFNENSEIEKSLPAGILCLSSSISGIKYQERLQQQFITCDDIFIEGARQKAHHIFIIFSSVQTKKLVLGTESDKLDRHFTLACWPPKHNVLYIKYYCCFTELYLISYLFSRFKDPIHSCQGFFFLLYV